ncbi:MAG: hypothetical protein KF903_09345 [Dokdonella sp.]|uniref:hypothetical protein n=1 Tax=Dokdonella sp. TaxID=2291710 RepID=UPI0025C0BEC9|nr:hypothetical protein [Dokdonella sp.]MBX3701187.1 hypothetical protein [Dokdonella sp.]
MTTRTPILAIAALLALSCGSAHAALFPVTGAITVNGNFGDLPAGTFGNSSYDPATGQLSSGSFVFPQSSVTVPVTGLGNVTVIYQLSQNAPSSAQVASDGVAAMTPVAMTLSVLRIDRPLPIATEPCHFSPINLELDGTGAASGLDLEDRAFTVPQTTDPCGGFASQINAALVGNSNSITVHLAGDFTPPAGDTDKIFVDGFDG